METKHNEKLNYFKNKSKIVSYSPVLNYLLFYKCLEKYFFQNNNFCFTLYNLSFIENTFSITFCKNVKITNNTFSFWCIFVKVEQRNNVIYVKHSVTQLQNRLDLT